MEELCKLALQNKVSKWHVKSFLVFKSFVKLRLVQIGIKDLSECHNNTMLPLMLTFWLKLWKNSKKWVLSHNLKIWLIVKKSKTKTNKRSLEAKNSFSNKLKEHFSLKVSLKCNIKRWVKKITKPLSADTFFKVSKFILWLKFFVFTEKFCKFGNACHFAHSDQELMFHL